MSPPDLIKTSKFLSLILRHKPEVIGVSLDPEGWIPVPVLISAMREHGRQVTPKLLAEIVETDEKGRYTIEPGVNGKPDRIRANQGHSIEIELNLEPVEPPEMLYHGTASRNVKAISDQGIVRGKRHHVHLSGTIETAHAVGRRHGKPVVLGVDAARMHSDGHTFFRSANGVWLTETVPPRYLVFLPN
jgi:putative RNA 2'-phosphotransferase